MKAIMVMFDSLNRNYLPCYGNDWVKAPNFERLMEKSLTFDRFYAASLPCMPARRELHTGRYNFMHRSWGPLEPFDVSMPRILKENGIYTHLVTDHFHYFEDGGATYHTKYNTWEFVRGQQGDTWCGDVADPEIPPCENPRKINLDNWRQDWVNRKYIDTEDKQPMPMNFELGIDFIERNKTEDNWFLQIETFDPHEPFYTMEKYKNLYPRDYQGNHYDWPNYGKVDDPEATVDHIQKEYAALVTMCDVYLGKVLDMMDENNMWQDTMLIVNTDHGFMLGEKEWYGKNIQPFYNEIVNTPFFIYDPRNKKVGERRGALCQTIDLAPTLLEFFGQEIPEAIEGKSLTPVINEDTAIRDAALFGMHGGHINVVDDKHVYMRANVTGNNEPLYEYTLMPAHMRDMFKPEEFKGMTLAEEGTFSFINCPVMKIPVNSFLQPSMHGHLLFDLDEDPAQETPLEDQATEYTMAMKMVGLMIDSEAPEEQFERLGYGKKLDMTLEDLFAEPEAVEEALSADSSMGTILSDPRGKAVMEQIMGDHLNNPMMKMAMGLSPRQLQAMAGDKFPAQLVEAIDAALKKI